MVREQVNRVKEHTSRKRPGHIVLLADNHKYKVKKERQDKWPKNIAEINAGVLFLFEEADI